MRFLYAAVPFARQPVLVFNARVLLTEQHHDVKVLARRPGRLHGLLFVRRALVQHLGSRHHVLARPVDHPVPVDHVTTVAIHQRKVVATVVAHADVGGTGRDRGHLAVAEVAGRGVRRHEDAPEVLAGIVVAAAHAAGILLGSRSQDEVTTRSQALTIDAKLAQVHATASPIEHPAKVVIEVLSRGEAVQLALVYSSVKGSPLKYSSVSPDWAVVV